MTDRKTVREEVVRQSVLPDETPVLPAVNTGAGARDANGRWRKGYSGMLGLRRGNTPDYKRCRELCRQHSEQSALGMIDLAANSLDDRVRFMANQWVYEQAWGKPREYDPAEDAPPKLDLLRLSPEQRQELRRLIEFARISRTEISQPEAQGPLSTDSS